MNCKEARRLIHAYVDGELDLMRSVELEGHLEDCGSCVQVLTAQRELKSAVRSSSLRFDTPAGLEKRIFAAAARESKAGAESVGTPWSRFLRPASVAFGVAAMALIAVMTWNIFYPNRTSGVHASLDEEVVANHVRSLMGSHLFDIASTDQHTVKPWFMGKLDYSPPVVDLKLQGFPLTGGRLDYLDARPVAALVYRHRKHVINLFVWPAASSESIVQPSAQTVRGYQMIHWAQGGMAFHAVSDINASDLKEFVRDIRDRSGK